MDPKRKLIGNEVLKKILPPLTAWAVRKILERPQRAVVAVRIARKARMVRKKAAANRVWIVAGAAVFIVGIAVIARAKRK